MSKYALRVWNLVQIGDYLLHYLLYIACCGKCNVLSEYEYPSGREGGKKVWQK